MRTRAVTREREKGVALLSAILVLMLMSALLVGFITMVNSDQAASGINRDQTQAYAAAHAGVEKLTADLGQLFQANFSPTGPQIAALTVAGQEPVLNGIQYQRPNGSTGYRISFLDNVGPAGVAPGDGNPDLESATGSTITSGPYQGLVGLITPYTVEVTAKTTGNAEVRMRRTLQTVAIPVFQFGIFSENDLSFFAGPNFSFGGRVHTNQHLFLKQDNGATLTLQDRVTAVGEILRENLANGNASHFGDVRMALAAGCPAAPTAINASCRNLLQTEGSVVGNPGSAQNEPTWTNLSTGTYNGYIRNGRTGARRLNLPVVSDGARPVDLIRRPPVGELATSNVGRQRFFNMATLRVLLSDSRLELTALPGVVGTPVPLSVNFTPTAAEALYTGAITNLGGGHAFAASDTGANYNTLLQNGYRTTAGTSSIGGYILINRQDRNGTWTDVTREILTMGFTGKRISNGNIWQINPDNNCVAPHPNAIIRVQRYRDTATAAQCGQAAPLVPAAVTTGANTGLNYWPNVLYDGREGMLRDDENNRPLVPVLPGGAGTPVGHTQFDVATCGAGPVNCPRLFWGGVMHYVEVDVNNLRRWLEGTIGVTNAPACANGGSLGTLTCAMDTTGYVLYFSDRRGNHNLGGDNALDNPVVTTLAVAPFGVEVTYPNDVETGELGFEDIINTASTSVPNNALDHTFTDAGGNVHFSEDLNWELPSVPAINAPGRGTLETYGGRPRLLPLTAAAGDNLPINRQLWVTNAGYTPLGSPVATPTLYSLYANPIDRNVARVNRAFFFRRALKLVNGGLGNLPRNGSQGLTVSSENPVYVEGNYNACTNALPNQGNNFQPACAGGVGFGTNPGVDHFSAAVIADAVTFLSNAWNDIRSFNTPHDPTNEGAPFTTNNRRTGVTTWFRTAVISGKGYNFPRASTAPTAVDQADWGTDGGAHNFLRFLEGWNGTLNYRGSIVSLYINRQSVGTYKCCSIVYGAPTRGYNFDTDFLQPTLLPPRTPMFRDINTLTFRQVLRPTQ
jgi:hypothetical protein